MDKPLDKEEIKRLLPPLMNLMDSGNVNYWLCGGILEKVHRNGDILERHNDIDIHVVESDIDEVCEILSTHNKVEFSDFNPPKRESYKVQFVRDPTKTDPRQLIIEVMILKTDNNGLYFNQYRTPNIYVPTKCFTGHQMLIIDEIKIKSPLEIDSYIEAIKQ